MNALARALAPASSTAVVHALPGVATSTRLDVALHEDIAETRRLLEEARARGVPFLLVSRLAATANRKGLLPEQLPSFAPASMPSAGSAPFDLDAELAALESAVAYARASLAFADQRSRIADETRRALRALGGASSGSAFDRAYARALDRELGAALERAFVERADGWRFNTSSPWSARGYTNALAELVVAREAAALGVAWAVVRVPALFADDADDADDAEQGVLAQLLDEARARSAVAPLALPAHVRLELLPVDAAARAIDVVARALARETAPDTARAAGGAGGGARVVQLTGPLPGPRLADLLALHARRVRKAQPSATGASALARKLARRLPAAEALPGLGAAGALLESTAELARGLVDTARSRGGAEALVDAVRDGAGELVGDVLGDLLGGGSAIARPAPAWTSAPPFFVDETRFSTRNLRLFAARAGLSADEAARTLDVDWRARLLGDSPGTSLEQRGALAALDEARAARDRARALAPRPAWDSLPHLLDEAAARYGSQPALSLVLPPAASSAETAADGETHASTDPVVDVSYTELRARARAVARRVLAALDEAGAHPGAHPGDGARVVLSGANHPAWGIAAFGVAYARAVLVPLDPNLEAPQVANIAKKARPALAILDKAARARFGAALEEAGARVLDLHLTAAEGPAEGPAERDGDDLPRPQSSDLASVLFTSGTTGDPKGVMLTHGNFTALLSSLQAIFPVGNDDRMLSVLPLHHTFEFSCGLLMPLASGARIYTPDALTGERVLNALKVGRITALVGVPALWQLLERRIAKQAAERGELVEGVLQALLAANRAFARKTGRSFGKVVLKPIHDQLGGHLRTLISGGSALPPGVHDMFQGLGLPLAEGYGLTEAAPVLTVAEGVPGAPAGTVGRPIPGVELRIVDADPATGVGEVWARAPNVMRGYFEDPASTSAALEDGWLKTGDLGLIDDDGRLRLVGRSKDVVVTAAGENVYLDDAEKKLEQIEHVAELTLLGLPDPRGGERLACAFVASTNDEAGRALALKALQQRLLKLPAWSRPAVVEAVDGPLPLTATRKVKRKEVRRTLEDLLAKRADSAPADTAEAPLAAVRAAIATVAGLDLKRITGGVRLAQDLGFDSLMWVELGTSLEPIAGKLDPERLVACESVADVEALVRSGAARVASGRGLGDAASAGLARLEERIEKGRHDGKVRLVDVAADLALPLVKPLGRAAISFAQREAYRTVFDARVSGRAFIPHNRSAIVVANHTSHLDTGLVKFALGSFGRELRPLAAKDYFFEGAGLAGQAKVAFFEHFTNLVPIDRETGSGLAFEQARAVVEQGHVVLIFPEGTRREDGTLGAFKPLVARLSLSTGVDVLPVWMKGNYDALPRGVHVPNLEHRKLEAHIGPPLEAAQMARLTEHLPAVQQARASTEIIRKAIVALSEGRMLELSRVKSLDELERGVVKNPERAAAGA